MIQTLTTNQIAATLESTLLSIDDIAVALSGGIDSLVLSAAVHRVHKKYSLFHAVSPAVPEQATQRAKDCAEQFGWKLIIIDANELADPNYRNNPIDRCFYCKSALYGTISSVTSAVILSGANVDDLAEYRPGLKAAENYGVRHPFIECAVGKNDIRKLAHVYGLPELSDLPASPCLSSRVETGITIQPDELKSINAIERYLFDLFKCKTVRCRLRAEQVVIEVDELALPSIAKAMSTSDLAQQIGSLLRGRFKSYPVRLANYQVGSAFVHSGGDHA